MKTPQWVLDRIASLEARGFDECRYTGDAIRVRCSQCESLVINGTACHENGCPNTPKPDRDSDEEDE